MVTIGHYVQKSTYANLILEKAEHALLIRSARTTRCNRGCYQRGIYTGAKLHSLHVSHLLFADDVLLLGEWSSMNISNVVNILNCFYKVSGLKLNLHKSNLYGVRVDLTKVSNIALVTGCQAKCLPFSYLGLPVGSNMARINSWVPIVDKFIKRLSRWKSSLLSIGDGFTFEFFRKFWNIVGPDLCLAVEWFFHHASFPVGCNSSFIALIPKTLNPKSVGEYRPISLIGSIYKIVTKILANRLSTVIADIISNVQTAFLPNRQILDGPFIINELLARCHHKKHSAMVFKIDFAKAYDSIRWDYLGDVLKSFGFGVKWCSWIRGILNSSMASILVNGSPTKDDMKKHCIKGKLELVVGVFKSCTPNSLGDMAVTLKDPTGTMGGTIHYKVFQNEDDGYAKSIKVGSVLILRNVSVWTPKPSQHYLNITIRNIVKVFDNDTEF
ncbi:RNA-directed DNA polymerase, eukaryota [Tanacetum coccineum]